MEIFIGLPSAPVDTRVVVRRWRINGRTIVALLPDNPGSEAGACKAFDIKDRFTDADYESVIKRTYAVDMNDGDVVELLRELANEGFYPKPCIAPRRRRETV